MRLLLFLGGRDFVPPFQGSSRGIGLYPGRCPGLSHVAPLGLWRAAPSRLRNHRLRVNRARSAAIFPIAGWFAGN